MAVHRAANGAIGSVPHGHWMTSTFIAGLRHDAIIAPCLFNCAMDGELFLAYVEQQLAPTSVAGSAAVLPSKTTAPSLSMMHTLISFSDTSSATYCSMAASPKVLWLG
jgi:hypothetical protein